VSTGLRKIEELLKLAWKRRDARKSRNTWSSDRDIPCVAVHSARRGFSLIVLKEQRPSECYFTMVQVQILPLVSVGNFAPFFIIIVTTGEVLFLYGPVL
jgi:hypothetical protein